jgi:hypothetical protein
MNNVDFRDLKPAALLKEYKRLEEILRGVTAVADQSKAEAVLQYLLGKDVEKVTTIRITAEELPKPKE